MKDEEIIKKVIKEWKKEDIYDEDIEYIDKDENHYVFIRFLNNIIELCNHRDYEKLEILRKKFCYCSVQDGQCAFCKEISKIYGK
jgi:hypothetical protein